MTTRPSADLSEIENNKGKCTLCHIVKDGIHCKVCKDCVQKHSMILCEECEVYYYPGQARCSHYIEREKYKRIDQLVEAVDNAVKEAMPEVADLLPK